MRALSTEQMKEMRDRNEDFVFLNVLPEEMYRKQHIPGSDNMPEKDKNFVQRVEQQAGSKDRKIVVYCANTECTASPNAARKLDEAGFTNVFDYEGGTAAWKDAGLPIEGEGQIASA